MGNWKRIGREQGGRRIIGVKTKNCRKTVGAPWKSGGELGENGGRKRRIGEKAETVGKLKENCGKLEENWGGQWGGEEDN